MCKLDLIFCNIYFSLPHVWGKVKLYRGKLNLAKKDKDITNFMS